MFSSEELKKMTSQAQYKLKAQAEQKAEPEVSDAPVDLYASFREDLEEISSYSPDLQEEFLNGHEEEMIDVSLHQPTEEEMTEDIELDPYDLAIFPDGPTRSQIELWKKEWQGHPILAVQIQDEHFVIRSLNRFEYKKLVSLDNIDALTREEVICSNCTLFPYEYNFKKMSVARGGIPSTLAQVIMEISGFTQEYQVSVL